VLLEPIPDGLPPTVWSVAVYCGSDVVAVAFIAEQFKPYLSDDPGAAEYPETVKERYPVFLGPGYGVDDGTAGAIAKTEALMISISKATIGERFASTLNNSTTSLLRVGAWVPRTFVESAAPPALEQREAAA